MKAYRASLLYFKGREAIYEQDGLLVNCLSTFEVKKTGPVGFHD